jgi:hypothetical protein
MNASRIKKLTIGGSYSLALICCLLALPQVQTQTPQTLERTLESVDRALNDPNAPAEIAIAAEPARHPLAGFLVRASVLLAITGTGGVIWSLFGNDLPSTPSTAGTRPPFLLPPASAPLLPYPTTNHRQETPTSPTPEEITTHPLSASPSQTNDPTSQTHPLLRRPLHPEPTTQADNFEQRRAQLYNYLSNSPGAWLLQLLEATPILIWGEQRSGKTELAQIIALLRKIFFFHCVEINDPHAHINSWLPCFPVFGGEFDYDAIDSRLIAYQKRLKTGIEEKKPITTIWDEFTQYAENCTCQKTQQFDFIKSIAAESQKKEEYPILISHGRTSTAKGGTTGTSEMFENGFIQIHLLAQRSPTGRAMPSGKGFLKGLSKDANGRPQQIAVSLPPWLRAISLYRYFPEIHPIARARASEPPLPSPNLRTPPQQPQINPPPYPAGERPAGERSPTLAQHLDNLMETNPLAPHLAAILEYAKRQGGMVKARDLQRASLAVLSNFDAQRIRLCFRELEALGKGRCEGEEASLSFVVEKPPHFGSG